MQLVTLHKVLILAATCVSLLFALWAVWMYGQRGSALQLVEAALAAGVAAGLVVYLRYFIRRTHKPPR